MPDLEQIAREVGYRKDLLAEIGGQVSNCGIDPAVLRDWGIYGGQQGIWVDKKRTVTLTDDGCGLAVSLLHKGHVYPDDFDETGVIYHYPVTRRPTARDLGEIEAVKNCARFHVPVFVIRVSESDSSKRDVYFGYVAMYDDQAKAFIVEFGLIESAPRPPNGVEEPFELLIHQSRERYETTHRLGQAAFRIAVIRRYGPRCAVCDVSVVELLDAAHLVPASAGGTDDARNGIPLCALHHRAFDKGFFAIEPRTFSIVPREQGPSKSDLAITKQDIRHLWAVPHEMALEYCWKEWLAEFGQ